MAAKSPNVVLVGFSRMPEREDQFHWILLYMRKPWVLYARQDAHFKSHSLEDARTAQSGASQKNGRIVFTGKPASTAL
jgi:hypothetical protein